MSDDSNDKSLDKQFGEGVKAAREEQGLTQEALVEAMQKKGFPYYQATIYKTEKGLRKTPVPEAVALAQILGYQVETLAGGPELIRKSALDPAVYQLNRSIQDFRATNRKFVEALLKVVVTANEHQADLTPREVEWLSKDFLSYTPANLAKEGFFYYDAIYVGKKEAMSDLGSDLHIRMYEDIEMLDRESSSGSDG